MCCRRINPSWTKPEKCSRGRVFLVRASEWLPATCSGQSLASALHLRGFSGAQQGLQFLSCGTASCVMTSVGHFFCNNPPPDHVLQDNLLSGEEPEPIIHNVVRS